ncbi:MAG: uracil-DNA glycosylase [Clostridiales bacterium]|jgi:uracil-DNA glycosylase|nr:uracil-DNA glycosylase [Clostridiales bacterium]HOB64713.1 uracil-DNA glycosylase [Clostridia bacterium]HOK81595.1 uracil-DNA glycosylase [Clostridia bacterium]HOL60492.1 uracil-DNA glycosylase [Clostridia bacterium]HPO52899.1 uracil-DNA glycosylase [Clostridia bacterium]
MVKLGNDWDEILKQDFESDWYARLREFLIEEYRNYKVYPDMYDIFNALKTTSYKDTRVVILGQDPYHNPGEAHGMCFSVKPGVKIPPSLLNIFKELRDDLGTYIPNNGYLMDWAKQGILLLNAILTVRENAPLSHKNMGWEKLTDSVIRALNERQKPVIFLLWGAPARAKKALITNPNHFVLEAPHPSPLSASYGFFGCRHFSKTNKILESMGEKPIDFQIKNI